MLLSGLPCVNWASVERRRVVWVDLADRRRPVSLFHPRKSPQFHHIWRRVLGAIRAVSRVTVSEGALEWAVQAAESLAVDGAVGLRGLLRCLSSAEARRWFLDTNHEPANLSQLLKMLAWALSYPAVHALSEGENRGDLVRALEKPSIVWLDSPLEHFEPKEHQLARVLAEAAIEDALDDMASRTGPSQEELEKLTVLHLYPGGPFSLSLDSWTQAGAGLPRHVAAHVLDPDTAPSAKVVDWMKKSEFLWVLGSTGLLQESAHSAWLPPAEAARLAALSPGDLWMHCNPTGKSVVTRVRDVGCDFPVVERWRFGAGRRRRTTTLGQVAAGIRRELPASGAAMDLYEKLADVETLRVGWLRVRQGGGKTPGVDGVTAPMFAANAEAELASLAAALRARQYRPRPLRRMQIPKPDGGKRDLGIACIRDRIVQAACLSLIEPIFERDFSRFSYAYRPRRNAHQAVGVAQSFMASGRNWAVIADIRKCFDNIDHDILLGLLARRIADEEMLALVRLWLTSDVLEFGDLLPMELGVPQGESISPLLANIYLDTLDRHLERLGISFVRYADDFVILTETQSAAQDALDILRKYLSDELHLELKPAKTFYVAVADGFDFLGFHLKPDRVTVREEKTEALLEYFKKEMEKFARNIGSLELAAASLNRMNALIRGWRHYYLLPGDNSIEAQLAQLDAAIDTLAASQMPESVRSNPAWLCRERLAMAGAGDTTRGRRNLPPATHEPGSGYPGDSPEGDGPTETEGTSIARRSSTHASPLASPEGAEPQVAGSSPPGAGVEIGDRLYVLSHGVFVTADKDDLVLRKKRSEVYRRPLEQIGLMYLQGFGINLSLDLQVKLAERDVAVVFAPPLGNPVAVIQPVRNATSSLRRLQATRRDEPDIVSMGLSMLSAKVGNQSAVLKYFAKYRRQVDPDSVTALSEAAAAIRSLSQDILRLDPAETGVRASVLGYEGHAAALYWRQVSALAPKYLGFQGRVTYSAQDVVNQCLNYTYGLLYGEVWRAVLRSGLDPYFGIIHGSSRDEGSLVFDLIEEFRAPFADRVVIGMLGRGFRPQLGEHGALRTSTKHQLVRAFTTRWGKELNYRSHSISPAQLVAAQAGAIAEVFRHNGRYHPFHMRW